MVCNLKVSKSQKQITHNYSKKIIKKLHFFFALASKKGLKHKTKELDDLNSYLTQYKAFIFFIQPFLRIGQNIVQHFVGFLEYHWENLVFYFRDLLTFTFDNVLIHNYLIMISYFFFVNKHD